MLSKISSILYKLPTWSRWPIFCVSALISFVSGFKAEDAQPNGWLIILCVVCALIAGAFFAVAASENKANDMDSRNRMN